METALSRFLKWWRVVVVRVTHSLAMIRAN